MMEETIRKQETAEELPICILVDECARERFALPLQKALQTLLRMEIPVCVAQDPAVGDQQIARIIVVPVSRMFLSGFRGCATLALAHHRKYSIVAVMQEPELEKIFWRDYPEVPMVPYYDQPGEKTPRQQLLEFFRQFPQLTVPEEKVEAEDLRSRLARTFMEYREAQGPEAVQQCEKVLKEAVGIPVGERSEDLRREILVARMTLASMYEARECWEKSYVNLLAAYFLLTHDCPDQAFQCFHAFEPNCQRRLGDLCRKMGRIEEAGKWYSLVKAGGNGEDASHEQQMAFRLYLDFGREMESCGDLQKAIALYTKARQMVYPLGQAEEELDWFRRFGDLLVETGDPINANRMARRFQYALIEECPRNEVLDWRACCYMNTQQDRAKVLCEKSYDNRVRSMKDFPSHRAIWDLGSSFLLKGKIEERFHGDNMEAMYQQALELYEKSGRKDLSVWDRRNFADALQGGCICHSLRGEREQLKALSLRAVEYCRALFGETGDRRDKELLIIALNTYARAWNLYDVSLEAERLCRELIDRYPSLERYRALLMDVHWPNPM